MKYIYVSDVDRALLGGARHLRQLCYAKSAATIWARTFAMVWPYFYLMCLACVMSLHAMCGIYT